MSESLDFDDLDESSSPEAVTHTGEVTGSTVLTIDPTAITGKATVVPVAGDFVAFSDTTDSGIIKKLDVVELLSVAGATDLSVGTTTATSLDVNSSTGINATLPQAISVTAAGLFSGADKKKLDDIELLADVTDDANVSTTASVTANTAKTTNVSTDLSIGTTTATTLDVNSSDGTNATIPEAIASTTAGLISGADKDKLDNVEALADVTDNVNVAATASVTANTAKVSADGLVTTHSDVTNSGSGIIISAAERSAIASNTTDISALTTGYSRRSAVISIAVSTAVPVTELSGDRYIIDFNGAPHANWDGAAQGDIVQFNGTLWVAESPIEGWIAYSDTDNKDALYTDDGVPEWELRVVSISSHNDLADIGIKSHATLDAEVGLNNAKVTNVSTDLSVGTTTATSLDVNSSDGTNATIPQAIATTAAGLLSGTDKAKLDGVELLADVTDEANVSGTASVAANTAKVTNVTTDLSVGTTTSTTLDVNSSDGTNATIPQAVATSAAGLLSGADKARLDGIESGADVTDPIDIQSTSVTETRTITKLFTFLKQTASGITTSFTGFVAGNQVTIHNNTAGTNTINLTINGDATPEILGQETFEIFYDGTEWTL